MPSSSSRSTVSPRARGLSDYGPALPPSHLPSQRERDIEVGV